VGVPRRRHVAVGLVVGALALAGCGGGSTALTDPNDIPPTRKGPPTDVSVCDLFPATLASTVLKRPLSVVGLEYGPSRLPTFRCLLGDEFGVATVTVELAPGPVARNVFLGAYGDGAGGDPKPVQRLGGMAYLRNEKNERSLHVYARGTILSLRLVQDPARPVPRRALPQLARILLERLPANPRLAGTSAGERCSRVSSQLVGAVIGIEPSRAVGLEAADGSVTCSWASFPGSVDVTVIRDQERVASYRDTIDTGSYVAVPSVGGRDVTALSREKRAGDLTLFVGDSSMALISAIPSAGYPDDSIATTSDEVALGREVVKSLL
jgi:hypothetical protein